MVHERVAPAGEASSLVSLALRLERPEQLGKLRSMLRPVIEFVGLSGDEADDLVLATHEIAANAPVHGQPPAEVTIQANVGTMAAVQVTDRGGLDLASRRTIG